MARTNGFAHDLAGLSWVEDLRRRPDVEPVLSAGAMASKDDKLPADHLFSALLNAGLLEDLLCLFSQERRQFYTLISLGANVCGHPEITHGGMTAAIVDETLGGLVYVLKREGIIAAGPAFTVSLDISYKAPLPARSALLCTASLERVDGRKTWVTAEVATRPEGATVYATGRALFVIPKDKYGQAAAAEDDPLTKAFARPPDAETEAEAARVGA